MTVSGLIVGPLFVVAELAFLLGMRHELKEQIEARAGGAVNPNRAVGGFVPRSVISVSITVDRRAQGAQQAASF
jgi:hypothetical protein